MDHPQAQSIQFLLDLQWTAELSDECVSLTQTQLTQKVLGLLGKRAGKCAYPVPEVCGETCWSFDAVCRVSCPSSSADWIWGRKRLWCPKAGEVLFPESGMRIKKLLQCLRETLVLETVLEIWLLHFLFSFLQDFTLCFCFWLNFRQKHFFFFFLSQIQLINVLR